MPKKVITLLHNPTAGDSSHEKEMLISIITKAGYKCRYRSVKGKRWKKIPPGTDHIAIAGGDGTVKKCMKLLQQPPYDQREWTIGLLPLGTANNVATTFGISGKPGQIVKSWGNKTTVFNMGSIKWGTEETFFCEAVGVGMFPTHLKEMKAAADEHYILPDRLQIGSIDLLRSAGSIKPIYCEIEIDGNRYDGEYLLAEVMNIRSIGPNIVLSPVSDVSDEWFDVVLIKEEQRTALSEYLYAKLVKAESHFNEPAIKGKNIRITAKHDILHIDDELKQLQEPVSASIKVHKTKVRFFIK